MRRGWSQSRLAQGVRRPSPGPTPMNVDSWFLSGHFCPVITGVGEIPPPNAVKASVFRSVVLIW